MGTSQSSKGSPSGVPMVPPWVPPLPPPPDPEEVPDETPPDGEQQAPSAPLAPEPVAPASVAPPGRFRATTVNLSAFARDGGSGAMKRGVGQYFSRGYGGGGNAMRRFSGSARTADALYGALSGGAAGLGLPEQGVNDSASAQAVMDAVTEAIQPVDGTQDAESSRAAIQDALSETLATYPDADLLNLTEEQKAFAIERYVAADVFRRFHLDVGRRIYLKAPNAVAAASRLKEVRDYVKETIAASFKSARDKGQRLLGGRVASIVRAALGEAIQVFEGYA